MGLLLGLALGLFLVAQPAAGDGQGHLQGGIVGRAAADSGGLAVDGGREGVRPHHGAAADHFIVGAVTL